MQGNEGNKKGRAAGPAFRLATKAHLRRCSSGRLLAYPPSTRRRASFRCALHLDLSHQPGFVYKHGEASRFPRRLSIKAHLRRWDCVC